MSTNIIDTRIDSLYNRLWQQEATKNYSIQRLGGIYSILDNKIFAFIGT